VVAAGDAVTLGIRPQQLVPGEGPGSIAARVTLVEHLGAETVVHALVTESSILAVLQGQRRIQPDETVRFAIDQAPLHVFDAAGLRVNPAVTGQ
jgi:multiple sugar transport system ATP-binding protein